MLLLMVTQSCSHYYTMRSMGSCINHCSYQTGAPMADKSNYLISNAPH